MKEKRKINKEIKRLYREVIKNVSYKGYVKLISVMRKLERKIVRKVGKERKDRIR
jgi:hypothetical protein